MNHCNSINLNGFMLVEPQNKNYSTSDNCGIGYIMLIRKMKKKKKWSWKAKPD